METTFYCPSCGECTEKETNGLIKPDDIVFQCGTCGIEWKIEIRFWEMECNQ